MILKQTTAINIPFWLVSATDNVSPITGLGSGPVVTLSKNGASFAAAGGTVTEIGNGWYNLSANTTDTGTLGALLLHATGTGAIAADDYHEVCVDLPGGTVSSVTGNIGGNVTGSVGSVTGLTASNVGAIKAKTDNLPSAPADETLIINATNAILAILGTPVLADMSHDIAAVLAAAATLGGIRKNVGVNGFPFRMFNNDGSPGLNLTVTGQVQLDGGSFANLTNAVVEVGNGWYKVNLANADVNGKLIALKFNGGTGVQETALLLVTDT